MRYMLLIHHDSSFTARTVKGDSAAWLEEMERRGVRKQGDRLRPAAEAKTVRMRDGKLLVRDGPFADAKEEISGYDIKCASWSAAKHSFQLAVRSEVGEGTTVTVRIPLDRPSGVGAVHPRSLVLSTAADFSAKSSE